MPLPRPPSAPSPAEGRLSEAEERFERQRRRVGLVLGPALFAVLLLAPPPGLAPEAGRLLAVVAWVLVWWITEAGPLPVTAVLGPALAVLLGVASAKEAFAPFGDPIIFLFLGSFLLAEAMSAHRLDRRLAGLILSVPAASSSPRRIVVSFLAIAAALSMWLSNSATTAMLYPIALGTLGSLEGGAGRSPLARRLLVACAYGASIGGIGTPVGSPPNLVAIGQLSTLAGIRVGFVPWMLVAIPILLAMAGATALVLGAGHGLRLAAGVSRASTPGPRGPMGTGERSVAFAVAATVVGWVGPGVLSLLLGAEHPLPTALARALPEGVVAVLGAGLLFVLPGGGERGRALTWPEATRIDWGTLLLFGGGLSLGAAMFRTGLSEALGRGLVGATGVGTTVGLTVVFSIFSIFFTEVTSNTAAATMLVPLAIASAGAAGVSPLEPALGCAIGCSMAFMLPVATPPNAIVYGSGLVPITFMAQSGLRMNLLASLLVPAGVLLLVPLVLR